MKRLTLFAALAVAAAPLATQAAEPINLNAKTAGQLAELCGANPKEASADAKINYCHGYTQGVVAMILRQPGEKKPFCFPTPPPKRGETLGQFAAWVKSIPERASLDPIDGFLKFMGERFPCK